MQSLGIGFISAVRLTTVPLQISVLLVIYSRRGLSRLNRKRKICLRRRSTIIGCVSLMHGFIIFIAYNLFSSPFTKRKKKWSKILQFFQRNTDILMNLIPDDDPQPTIFGMSKRVLTRPKSQAKYRPYSVSSSVSSPLAVRFGNFHISLVCLLSIQYNLLVNRRHTG
jgi:predicted PurR-regulated permease PerM